MNFARLLSLSCLLFVLAACSAARPATPAFTLTEPQWITPPEDSAVNNPPSEGYYFVNQDHSIWASAGYAAGGEYRLHAGPKGNKVGWFRPAGADLVITGRRMDASAPPLEAEVPCCYPSRFQASGLIFPTEGIWEVTASAAESRLIFVVEVQPEQK